MRNWVNFMCRHYGEGSGDDGDVFFVAIVWPTVFG